MTRLPSAVSPLESHLGYWLRFVSNHVSHAFRLKVEARGVTLAEWVVLRALFDEKGVNPSQLAGQLGMTRGAISKLADRLVAKALITRRERADDRRYQTIALTPAARRLLPRLAALADQNDEEFFHPLSAKERAALVAIMKKLVQAHGLHTLPTE